MFLPLINFSDSSFYLNIHPSPIHPLVIFQISDSKRPPPLLCDQPTPVRVWFPCVSTATEFKSKPTARAFLGPITMVTWENEQLRGGYHLFVVMDKREPKGKG